MPGGNIYISVCAAFLQRAVNGAGDFEGGGRTDSEAGFVLCRGLGRSAQEGGRFFGLLWFPRGAVGKPTRVQGRLRRSAAEVLLILILFGLHIYLLLLVALSAVVAAAGARRKVPLRTEVLQAAVELGDAFRIFDHRPEGGVVIGFAGLQWGGI